MAERTPSPYAGLSRREREIMDVLFNRGEATVAEVMEGMASPPSYSAVRATLRVLVEKGRVTHRQEGLRYVYLPVVEPGEASTAALEHVVRTFFGGSADEALAALLRISDTDLTEEDVERLARLVRKARDEGR
jgi:BlaI family transcriptional regulator, penicillinase repressor